MDALLVEATASSVLFVEEDGVAGMAKSFTLVGFDAMLGLGLMFLGDLHRGVTGGGLVTKLLALILVELGSLFGHNFTYVSLQLGSNRHHYLHLLSRRECWHLQYMVIYCASPVWVSCLTWFGNGFPQVHKTQIVHSQYEVPFDCTSFLNPIHLICSVSHCIWSGMGSFSLNPLLEHVDYHICFCQLMFPLHQELAPQQFPQFCS